MHSSKFESKEALVAYAKQNGLTLVALLATIESSEIKDIYHQLFAYSC